MENEVNKSSGWPGFFQSNSPLAWLIAITGILLVSYLVLNGAIIEGCGVKITPVVEKQQDHLGNTKQGSENENTQTTNKINPIKERKIIKNEPALPEQTSKVNTVSPDEIKFQSSVLHGQVVDQNGRPAEQAKVTCKNCAESNSPIITDASGNFQMKYKIGYKAFEYPVKKIELTIFHKGLVFSASQSITQNSIKVDLK